MVETDASVGGELILLVTMIGLLYQVKRDRWERLSTERFALSSIRPKIFTLC
jgi:hypothetical protein